MTTFDIQLDTDYVVYCGERMGLRIGKVVGFAGNDRNREILVTLRQGCSTFRRVPGFDAPRYKYAKLPRKVNASDIRRLASPREVMMQIAIDPVPGGPT